LKYDGRRNYSAFDFGELLVEVSTVTTRFVVPAVLAKNPEWFDF